MSGGEAKILAYEASPRPADQSQVVSAALWAMAAGLLGAAIQSGDGHFTRSAIQLLTGAILLGMAGLTISGGVFGRIRAADAGPKALLNVMLIAMVAWQFFVLFDHKPGRDSPLGGSLDRFVVGVSVAGILVLAAVCSPPRVQRVAFAIVLGVFAVLGVWMIRSSPNPPIDSFVFHQEQSANLLAGRNPYTTPYTDIYATSSDPAIRAGAAKYLPAGASVGGKIVLGFPYPPTSLYCSAAGYAVTGDFRYANLAAMIVAAALIFATRPGTISVLAASLFLFTPRSLFVLEQGWTEPYAMMFFAMVIFCAVRARWALPIALGLFLSVKQYFILVIPLTILLIEPPFSLAKFLRLIVPAALVAVVLTLPLLVWDPAGYFNAVWVHPFRFPFRSDSLSYLALIVEKGGPQLGVAVGLGVIVPLMALMLRITPRTPGGFAAAVAMVCLVFFAFNKQAFCNYYYFVIGALAVAISAGNLGEIAPNAAQPPAETLLPK